MKLIKALIVLIFSMIFSHAQERSFEIIKEFRNVDFTSYRESISFISSFFNDYLKEMSIFNLEDSPINELDEEEPFKILDLLLENTSQHNKYKDKRGLLSIRLEGEDLILRVSNPHETTFPNKIKNQRFYVSQINIPLSDISNFIPEDQRGANTNFGMAIGSFLSDLKHMTNNSYKEDVYTHFYESVDPETWDKLFNVEIVFPKVKKDCPSLHRIFFEVHSR